MCLLHGCDEIHGLLGQWEEVNKIDHEVMLGEVQWQFTSATNNLIKELEKHFPHQEVIYALGIC